MRIVGQSEDIDIAQQLLESRLKDSADVVLEKTIGYKGGQVRGKVFWFSNDKFWVFFEKLEKGGLNESGAQKGPKIPKYWNAFGTEDPNENEMLSITCEINFPLSGIERRVAGAFAKDDANRLYVVYRGKIGGGRKGIGQTLFFENYQGNMITVDDGGRETRVALV